MKIRPKNIKKIALKRIWILFNLAENEKDERLRDRYVELILKIAQKARVRLPRKIKRRICKYCHSFLVPGVNCRVRIGRDHKVIYYCLKCRRFMRFPYVREIKERRRTSNPQQAC